MQKPPAVRFMVDAAVGAAVFTVLTIALLGPTYAAQFLTAGTMTPSMATVYGGYHSQSLLLVVAVVFSALFALNLAFVRHVRQVAVRARARRTHTATR